MATYKVIQDIEAEDKLVGPFGIRQFIYLLIVAVSLYMMYRLGEVLWFLALPFLPHTLFFGLLALPFGGEQPTETWLLAKIRFALKPRKRIWNQSGIQELVTITVPKAIERHLTKEMSQNEVHSRLEALANTIDSRGWATKNVDVNLFSQPAFAMAMNGLSSDRLVSNNDMLPRMTAADVTAQDDMLDAQNNPTAQKLEQMISASSKARREQLMAQMQQPQPSPQPATLSSQSPARNQAPAPTPSLPQQTSQPAPASPQDYWFLQPGAHSGVPQAYTNPYPTNVVTPNIDPRQNSTTPAPTKQQLSEQELLDKIHAEQEKPKNYGHMRVIKPMSEQQAEAAARAKAAAQPVKQAQPITDQAAQVTPAPNTDIIELANNDDLNVETIARQAHKRDKPSDGEVVINLH